MFYVDNVSVTKNSVKYVKMEQNGSNITSHYIKANNDTNRNCLKKCRNITIIINIIIYIII